MIIYKATSKITGLVYIGQTIRKLKERIRCHKKDPSGYFGNAIEKYGIESFTFEVLDDTARTVDELNMLERKYIRELNTIRPHGYNLQIGGLNKIVHRSTLEKISYSRHTPIDCKCVVTGVTYSFRNINQVKNFGFCPKQVQNALKYRGRVNRGFIWKYRNDNFHEYDLGRDFVEYRRDIEDYIKKDKIYLPRKKIVGVSQEDGHILRLDFMKDIRVLDGSEKHLGDILNGRRPNNPYKNYQWYFEEDYNELKN